MNQLIFLLLAALPAAFAQTSVDGQLTVAGKTMKFTNVYAFAAQGFFDKEKTDTVVLLTNGPLTEVQMRDEFALRKLARDGKISFVKETIDTLGQIISFTIGDGAFRMAPSGGSTDHVFEGKIEGKTIRGKVLTKVSQRSFDVRYDYMATFTVNILPRK